MAGKIHERLLEEFSGLFDGETTGLASLAGGQGDLNQSLAETVAQLGQVAAVLPANLPAGAALSPANNDMPVQTDRLVSGSADVTQSLTDTVHELSQVAPAAVASLAEGAATPAGTNTRGGSPTTNSSNSGTSVESIATTFLESGLGIVPLITGLIGLFSGGSDTPPALERYAMPSSISFDSADTGNGLSAADFDQTGAPRVYNPAAGAPSGMGGGTGLSPTPGPPAAGASAPPQITVNVQAMDAQSFMDYSSQIAQAVRGAMLNLSSLNDVVSEL